MKIRAFIVALSLVFAILLTLPINIHAQDPLESICSGSGASSPVCRARTYNNPLLGPNGIITRIIQLVVLIIAVSAVIVIMIGGFKYLISAGDPNKTNSAKNTILYAVIGIVVAVLAQAIVSLVLRRL